VQRAVAQQKRTVAAMADNVYGADALAAGERLADLLDPIAARVEQHDFGIWVDGRNDGLIVANACVDEDDLVTLVRRYSCCVVQAVVNCW